MKRIKFVGLDVHAETVTWRLPNRREKCDRSTSYRTG